MSEWISVNERLPKEQSLEDKGNEYLIVKVKGYNATKAMYCDGEWYVNYFSKIVFPVTHWMQLEGPEND